MKISSLSSMSRPVINFAKSLSETRLVMLVSAVALIVILAVAALFTFGFPNFFKKKIQPTAEQSDPIFAKIHNPANLRDPLLMKFSDTMDREMGGHLYAYQKVTLIDLFHQAMQSDHPRQTLDVLITQKINTQNGWGKEKAEHLRKNLLNLMPVQKSNSIKTIAETPINSQGDRLVCFYKNGETEFLGNFALCPSGISLWGKTFRCSEAAFQWRKFWLAANENKRMDMLNDPKMNEFFQCTGEEAFELRKYFDHHYPQVFVSGWLNGQRDQVMWEILRTKFEQNKEFAMLLQETKGAYLLEHNPVKGRDSYWSDDHDGTGYNMLGKMLMAIRDNQPRPNSNVKNEPDKMRTFAAYANQPGALSYKIF